MNRRRAPRSTGGTIRRWHLPPPLVHGPEPLEGGAVLAEIPGAPGLLLWQALRDVLLWAATPPDERHGLFAHGAAARRRDAIASTELEPHQANALAELATLVEDPAGVRGADLAAACRTLARWAEGEGRLATALAFAQNAALASSESAEPALEVARLAARLGDHARAELWFRRAVGIGRREAEWRLYTRAFAGLGSLYRSRGNLPAAQRFHLRALRGARRGGLREERATALHDLFGVAVEGGRPRDAERLAREALASYPPASPRIGALAHDVAYHWLEQESFARALRVFQAVEPLLTDPAERLWLDADLMRAAAGAGDASLARRMAKRVRARLDDPAVATAAPRACLELAHGELRLGAPEAAERAARTALERATGRRDNRTAFLAEALLQSLQDGSAAAPRRAPRSADAASGDELAAALILSLQALGAAVGGGAEAPATAPVSMEDQETLRPEAHTR